jgi:pyruvate dehydrogenase E2 component (dihydrolipoamide acetyltransferase)/2-oxoisovalerate dehydrogenase E2 component (dihydrolipoyl transacylase)
MMDFHLPELGEGVYEAELVEWRVQPGDAVKRGQELAEVVTDKASMPLPAPFFGRIGELRAHPGDMIKVGEVLLTFEPSARGAEAKGAETKNPEAKRAEAKPSHDADGQSRPRSAEGAPARNRKRPERGSATAVAERAPAPANVARASAAPTVRRMARELGIDLASVSGSGPGGRVLIGDLMSLLRRGDGLAKRADGQELEAEDQSVLSGSPPSALRSPPPDYGAPGTRRKLIGIRRQIAEHMVQSKRTIPHYSYVDECNLSDLVRLRASLKETFAQRGLKLTYLPFFVKAVVEALKEIPLVNASLDESAGEIVLHDRYDIGIAVATPSGLLVPVVREADRKDITEIAREIEQLSRSAREGTARRDELRGGTFTITSIGGIGGLISTPVINHPEAAILGIGRVVRRPVYDEDGNLRPADLVYLSFSFDHRILDGAIGAAFGNAVIRRLQSPAALLVSPH